MAICHFSSNLPTNLQMSSIGLSGSQVQSWSFGYRLDDGFLVYLTNEVFVQQNLNALNFVPVLEEKLRDYDGSFIRTSHDYSKYKFNSSLEALLFSIAMSESGAVEYAVPDMFMQFHFMNDPLYSQQFQLDGVISTLGPDGYVDIDINAPEAWAIQTGSSNITVAVFDDGIELHEDLNEANLIPGWNTQSIFLTEEEQQGLDEFYINGECWLNSYHGMSVAGIIAAQHNNIGCRGVAPNVKLMPIRILFEQGGFLDGDGVVECFYKAADEGIDIINCSWAINSCGFEFPALDAAINYATEYGRNGLGTVVVFSSGNDGGCVNYPAEHPNVIAVGALFISGELSAYSAHGEGLDLVAPSSGTLDPALANVITIDRMDGNGQYPGNYTEHFGGTSAAAPLVSGAAALILSQDPTLTESEVRQILYNSASDLGTPGWDTEFGHGNLNIYNALVSMQEDVCGGASDYDFGTHTIVGDGSMNIVENTSFETALIIEAGGTLTVAPGVILSFGPDAKLVIKDEATLNLNGVTLTSYCPDKMWWGIEIWDDVQFSLGEISEIQWGPGLLTINNCTITNAHFGIALGHQQELDPDFFAYEPETVVLENQDGEYTIQLPNPNIKRALYFGWHGGGKLFCANNIFSNCAVGIYMPGHTYGMPRRISQNEVTIKSCSFSSDNGGLIDEGYNTTDFDTYPDAGHPYYFQANNLGRGCVGILLHGIRKTGEENDQFTISECVFANLEWGIKGVNAYFNATLNNFDELQYGIQMAGANMNGIYIIQTDPSIISDNTFTHIYDPNPGDLESQTTFPYVHWTGGWNYGIDEVASNTAAFRADNAPNIHLEHNMFGLPSNPDFEHHTNAIFINNCRNFTMNTLNNINLFERGAIFIDTDDWIWGECTVGSDIYNPEGNSFFRCKNAIVTGQDNFNLQLRCNNFKQDEMDNSTDIQFWQNAGVLGNQGYEPAEVDDVNTGAGNTFLPEEMASAKTIISEQVYEGGMFDMDYADTGLSEDNISEAEYVDAQQGFIYYHYGDDDDLNEHKPLPYSTLSDVQIAALLITFDENNSCTPEFHSHDVAGDSLMHYVSSRDMAARIEDQLEALDEHLQAIDDYNTQTAIMLNAIYGGIQNEYELKEFLTNNSPLSRSVLAAYMQRYNVPAQYFMEVFELNSVIDMELAQLLDQKIEDMPAAIAAYLQNIALVNPAVETATKIRRRITEYGKVYRAAVTNEVSHHYKTGNKVAAIDLLEEQSGIHPKQLMCGIYIASGEFTEARNILNAIPATTPEIAQWKALKNIQVDMLQGDTEASRNDISNLVQGDDHHESSAVAQGLFEGLGMEFCMVFPKVVQEGTRQWAQPKVEAVKSEIIIYPNPATDYVRIKLPLSSGEVFTISIFDPNGKLIQTNQCTMSGEDAMLELHDLHTGEYTIEILSKENKMLLHDKLIIK